MGLLDLIIEKKDEKPSPKKEEKYVPKFPDPKGQSSFPTTFPSAEKEQPVQQTTVPLVCEPHMENIMKLYESGFSKLNKPGIEFYEFFEAVTSAGVDNPTAYKMALNMLSKMEKTMSKESLISQSQYYIDELNKVHNNYNSTGITKRQDLLNEKSSEEHKLKNDVELLKGQLDSIKQQIQAKELQLTQMESKYQPKLTDIDCKIMANDLAKERILSAISAVINGIKNNL